MSDCCVIPIPGPRGVEGADGTDGADGVNAFTLTTDAFAMPAVGNGVTVDVEDGSWASPNGGAINGQAVHVQFAGYFFVVSVSADGLSMELNNLGYAENVAPTTVIPLGAKVSPTGVRGP